MVGRDAIRFVLDGELIELDDVDPTRTVLQFLREDLRRTGTKEGCAEGDCGACTVAVVDIDAECRDLTVRAVNSCIQFLPTLDGKELITVESLNRNRGKLHPVQQAMVDCHASQCGFCTPGFVMSLFALYKNTAKPSRVDIDDALAGNLCRCTGYRPIIDAAERMYSIASGEDWLGQPAGAAAAPAKKIETLRKIAPDGDLRLEYDGRRFIAPASRDGLARALDEFPDATLLAGGTDVGLWVTKQYRDLGDIIYTGRVRELARIVVTPTHIEFGAGVTFTEAMPVLIEHFPALVELLKRFASPPIRNAATIGGNIANGSPIGDSMPALIALGATLSLGSARGSRKLELEDFYKDYMVNTLGRGEFVEAIRVPKLPGDAVFATYKISKRFDQDISAVCAAFCLSLDGEAVSAARIAFGGMAATVRRAPNCERSLVGERWDEQTLDKAAAALARDFTPIDDMRATADYRLRVAQNLLRRLFLESRGDLPQTLYAYGRAG